MAVDTGHRPDYFRVWVWLVLLVIVSTSASLVLPKSAALLLIFTVALVKALLVALNYMHLKYEKPLLYALAAAPLLIVVILFFALFPDFVFHR
ncbi:MAG TPA: cytochrome C oxidase subunit IV family protein [Candidatus Acidoferrales bacterium]|nr:cytochrome C oxidase subunit IV family protein [Candidatus Acidoferrales bacterium]